MKRLIFGIMLILASVSVLADAWPSECTDAGFDYGIAKFQCRDTSYDEGPFPGYTASVTWHLEEGECDYVDWTVVPKPDGIISKEGSARYVYTPVGTSGRVNKTAQNAISHITFCGNNNDDVPEFGLVGSAAVLAGAGLYLFLKRK